MNDVFEHTVVHHIVGTIDTLYENPDAEVSDSDKRLAALGCDESGLAQLREAMRDGWGIFIPPYLWTPDMTPRACASYLRAQRLGIKVLLLRTIASITDKAEKAQDTVSEQAQLGILGLEWTDIRLVEIALTEVLKLDDQLEVRWTVDTTLKECIDDILDAL